MDQGLEFVKLVGAVIGANLLTLLFVYCMWAFTKRERMGTDQEASALWLLGGMLIAPVVVVLSAYLWTTT